MNVSQAQCRFAGLIGVLLMAAGCDWSVGVNGTVHDPHGRPILGATVTMPGIRAVSARNGCFAQSHMTGYPPPFETVTAAATGYKSTSIQVRREPNEHRMTITLVPFDSAGTSTIVPSGDSGATSRCVPRSR